MEELRRTEEGDLRIFLLPENRSGELASPEFRKDWIFFLDGVPGLKEGPGPLSFGDVWPPDMELHAAAERAMAALEAAFDAVEPSLDDAAESLLHGAAAQYAGVPAEEIPPAHLAALREHALSCGADWEEEGSSPAPQGR